MYLIRFSSTYNFIDYIIGIHIAYTVCTMNRNMPLLSITCVRDRQYSAQARV